MTAGFLLVAAAFAAMVAVSHPVATALVLAGGAGTYALRGVFRRTDVDRTVQLCRPRVCFQFRLRIGGRPRRTSSRPTPPGG